MMCMTAKKRHPWGASLRKLRNSKGLTQEGLCERIKVPLSTLRNWEQGRVAPPFYVRRLIEKFLRDFGG